MLLYSPVWIAFVGTVMLTGLYRSWDDPGYMLFGIAAAAPAVLIPYLRPHVDELQRPFWDTTWFRMNLWVAVLVWFGSYFGSHYFFDVLGMRYAFPTSWNLQAEVVGQSTGEVPLFLYPLTQAYFLTYHVGMSVLYRWLRTRFGLRGVGRAIAVFVLAYAVAFAETFFMAIPALEDVFSYPDRTRMLTIGSLFYASYFVVSLPVFARLDEGPQGERQPWTLLQTLGSSLAVSMVVLILLDLWALIVGRLL